MALCFFHLRSAPADPIDCDGADDGAHDKEKEEALKLEQEKDEELKLLLSVDDRAPGVAEAEALARMGLQDLSRPPMELSPNTRARNRARNLKRKREEEWWKDWEDSAGEGADASAGAEVQAEDKDVWSDSAGAGADASAGACGRIQPFHAWQSLPRTVDVWSEHVPAARRPLKLIIQVKSEPMELDGDERADTVARQANDLHLPIANEELERRLRARGVWSVAMRR